MAEPPRLRVDPDERPRPATPRGRPRQAPQRAPRGKRPPRRLLRGAAKLGVLLSLWAVIVGGGALAYFALTLPDTSQLTVSERRPSVTILAEDGSLIASFGDLFGRPLTLKEMSPYLPNAVIATEDRRFYSHFGIDPVGHGACRGNRSARRANRPGRQHDHPAAGQDPVPDTGAQPRPQDPRDAPGAVARAPLRQGPDPRNLSQPGLSRRRRPMGSTLRRIAISANRPPSSSLFESAVIAGLLKAPTRFSPARDRDKAAGRAGQVLANMVEAGFITAADAAAAAERGRRAAGRRPAGIALFRRLGGRPAPRLRRHRRPRPDRPHHPRPAAASRGGGVDRRYPGALRGQGCGEPGRARRAGAGWGGARDGRRPRLRPQPVQPRDPGAAPAGLGVQAVRLPRRARSRVAPVRPLCRHADPGRQLAAAQLSQPLPGAR